MKLDFYLPDLNVVIECQGEQHFNKFRYNNEDEEEKFKIRQIRDEIKYKLCKKYLNPTFIYYTDTKYEYCNGIKMIKNINKLIKKIKQIEHEKNNDIRTTK